PGPGPRSPLSPQEPSRLQMLSEIYSTISISPHPNFSPLLNLLDAKAQNSFPPDYCAFFFRGAAFLAGGAACAGQPSILSLLSTSKVSMNGSFLKSLRVPSNCNSVPGSALPGSAVSNLRVTCGLSSSME